MYTNIFPSQPLPHTFPRFPATLTLPTSMSMITISNITFVLFYVLFRYFLFLSYSFVAFNIFLCILFQIFFNTWCHPTTTTSSYFIPPQDIVAPPSNLPFTGRHLPFVGFTFTSQSSLSDTGSLKKTFPCSSNDAIVHPDQVNKGQIDMCDLDTASSRVFKNEAKVCFDNVMLVQLQPTFVFSKTNHVFLKKITKH